MRMLKRVAIGYCSNSTPCNSLLEAMGLRQRSSTNNVSNEATETTSTMPWKSEGSLLTYNGKAIQVLGLSLTATHYIAGIPPDLTYYDFVNKKTTDNLDRLADIIKQIKTDYNKTVIRAPMIRIPICADYWLLGSATTGCVQTFTGDEYKNAIIAIINRFWDLIENNLCSFVIDLHWNYAGGFGGSQASYSNGTSNPQLYLYPSDQQSMPLSTNTITFWRSICDYFGVNSSGQSLTSLGPSTQIKQNTFFELYNEPFIDSQIPNDYQSYYYSYINGYSAQATGISLTNGTADDRNYYYTGMGQMFCEIRTIKKAFNILNIAGNAGYAYMDTWNFYDYDNHKIITSSHNCFTELFANIKNGTVIDPNGNPYNSTSSELVGITLGFHPYSEHSGSYKTPGYNFYYTGESIQHSKTDAPRLGDLMLALSTPGTNFSSVYPFLFTEFGQYEAPWGNYDPQNPGNAIKYALTDAYGTIIGDYPGGYYNKTGTFITCPGNIGTIYDCDTFWASYSIWAGRPNIGYYDGSTNADNVNNSWSAYGPDVLTGSQDPSAVKLIQLISTANSNLSGNNGSDFQFIFDNYMANDWY